MHKVVSALLFLIAPALWASEPVSSPSDPMVVYKTDAEYDDIKENVEMAITGKGLVISGTLHISEMLQRTAQDTGQTAPIYTKAEALEFCSVALSYQMSKAHPANMASCPLTISIYTLPEDENTYVAYRKPGMMGDAQEAEQAFTTLMSGIIKESLE
jgi:uncharacterized protein (DUF302 family)